MRNNSFYYQAKDTTALQDSVFLLNWNTSVTRNKHLSYLIHTVHVVILNTSSKLTHSIRHNL
jgi:hypothetical protein